MARERYVNQVRLLVDILPAIAAEEEFALKGGTAINLFYRELPRLSVDVDLTFLPIKDRAQSLAEINAAMDRIAAAGSKVRGVSSTRIPGGGGGATRVMFQRGTATVKVETSPVMRGVVFEPEFKRVSPAVEDEFGFAETRLVAFEDLFAGKLHAALDRQHPRDLFDVKLLYEHEGITDDLFRAFLVYVASSNRPPHELLNPNLLPLEDVFEKEFSGMTNVRQKGPLVLIKRRRRSFRLTSLCCFAVEVPGAKGPGVFQSDCSVAQTERCAPAQQQSL